jgi:peroxiredoxin
MSRWSKVVVLLGLALSPLVAVYAADDASKKDDAPKKVDQQAKQILEQAASYLQGLQSFTNDLKSTLKVKAPVANQEMAAVYSLAVEKPNHLAIMLKDGNMGATVVCDGKELIIFVPRVNKYSVEEAPKTLAELTHGPGIMANMVHSISFSGLFMLLDPTKELFDDVDSAEYVGEEKLDDQPVHHLKVATQATDFDYWIEKGDKPLVRKIVPNMAKALERSGAQLPEGVSLEMTAVYSDWKTDPKLTAEQFKFSPPETAQKVESLFGPSAEAKRHPLLGKDAPSFELDNLDGKLVKLDDLKEKDVVILDFWATWCGPCVKALPIISSVAAEYKAKGVTFYAVNVAEDAETVSAFLKEKDLKVPVLLDKEGKVAGLYGAEGIPQTVLIGKDGVVQVVHVGLSQDLKSKLTHELDDLLAGKKLSEEADKPGSKEKSDDKEKPDAK